MGVDGKNCLKMQVLCRKNCIRYNRNESEMRGFLFLNGILHRVWQLFAMKGPIVNFRICGPHKVWVVNSLSVLPFKKM